MDGNAGANPGSGVLSLRAEAFGPHGTHRVIEATVARTAERGAGARLHRAARPGRAEPPRPQGRRADAGQGAHIPATDDGDGRCAIGQQEGPHGSADGTPLATLARAPRGLGLRDLRGCAAAGAAAGVRPARSAPVRAADAAEHHHRGRRGEPDAAGRGQRLLRPVDLSEDQRRVGGHHRRHQRDDDRPVPARVPRSRAHGRVAGRRQVRGRRRSSPWATAWPDSARSGRGPV